MTPPPSVTADSSSRVSYVSSCICERISFCRVLEWARDHDVESVGEVQEGLGCGARCGLCLPYIAEVLRTGETNIALIPFDEK